MAEPGSAFNNLDFEIEERKDSPNKNKILGGGPWLRAEVGSAFSISDFEIKRT